MNIFSLRVRLSLLAFILITLGMAIYEWIKTLFLPDISLWESHAITTFFSGIIGAIAIYFLYGNPNIVLKEELGKVRTKIFTPIVLAIIALVVASLLSTYIFVEKITEAEHVGMIKKVKELYTAEVHNSSRTFLSLIGFISRNKNIQEAYSKRDRQELLSIVTPLYKELNEKHQITHFYFHTMEKVCFLRAHKPDSYGDLISRNTIQRAEKSGKPVSGIELGTFGTLTLRTVLPWHINGELVGYIELGMEVNEIIEKIKELFNIEFFVIIKKEFLNKGNWEKGISMLNYKSDWNRFEKVVVINNPITNFPTDVEKHFEEGFSGEQVHSMIIGNNDIPHTIGHFPLIDDRGEMIGLLAFLESQQEAHLIMSNMMTFQILFIITIGLLLSITLFIYISRIEVKLAKARKDLIDHQEELEKRVEGEVGKRRQNEQRLMHQAKLAAMGEMIGAISHQWRQPLNNLGLFIQGIDDAYEYNELNKEFIEETVRNSMEQIDYMSSTIDDFRNFFKPSKEKIDFCVVKAVKDVESLTSAQLAGCFIKFDFLNKEREEQVSVHGYPNEFKQVLLNLVSNAKDVIMEKQEKLQNKLKGDGKISVKVFNHEDLIVLEIADNGGGVPEEILERIFEPYFSTKEEGKGSGIGLYMSKVIIEQNMNGRLHVRNRDEGAVFTIEVEALTAPTPQEPS